MAAATCKQGDRKDVGKGIIVAPAWSSRVSTSDGSHDPASGPKLGDLNKAVPQLPRHCLARASAGSKQHVEGCVPDEIRGTIPNNQQKLSCTAGQTLGKTDGGLTLIRNSCLRLGVTPP